MNTEKNELAFEERKLSLDELDFATGGTGVLTPPAQHNGFNRGPTNAV